MEILKLPVLCLGMTLLLVSCEDEELKKQAEAHRKELQQKEAHLNLLRKEVTESTVKDPTEKLAELESQIEDIKTQVKDSKDEVRRLTTEKAKVEKDFLEYQRKYPIRER